MTTTRRKSLFQKDQEKKAMTMRPDLLWKILDAVYQRGWTDRGRDKDFDPRGTEEWQVAQDVLMQLLYSSGVEQGADEEKTP